MRSLSDVPEMGLKWCVIKGDTQTQTWWEGEAEELSVSAERMSDLNKIDLAPVRRFHSKVWEIWREVSIDLIEAVCKSRTEKNLKVALAEI